MNKDILRLSACQALFMSSSSIMIATSAIVGASLSDKPQFATIGVGLSFLAMMLFTYPTSILMGRVGRRGGFITGLIASTTGALIIATAIWQKHFAMFCAGSFVMGAGMASGQYFRFAAVEVAGGLYKGKAISYVLAGGIVAAVLGPNLARYGHGWFNQESFAGAYFCAAILYILVICIVSFISFDDFKPADVPSMKPPLKKILKRPVFLVSACSALTAYACMNLIMTATPLSMAHHGHTFTLAAFVIQWHILGMYIPSLLTGILIEKLGLLPMMLTGCLLLMASTVINVSGLSYLHFSMALILLGVGWNFLYVGATQLLTSAYAEEEKSSVQGLNDFMVAASVAVTALCSGWFFSHLGWITMNILVSGFAIFALSILLWFYFSIDHKQLNEQKA